MHCDLRRPNVTLALLWEEYRAATTDGFGYSWFCDLYRERAGRIVPHGIFRLRGSNKPSVATAQETPLQLGHDLEW